MDGARKGTGMYRGLPLPKAVEPTLRRRETRCVPEARSRPRGAKRRALVLILSHLITVDSFPEVI
jgi:hypothetical protein